MADQVADLYAAFGLQTNLNSFAQGTQALNGVTAKVTQLGAVWKNAQGKTVQTLQYTSSAAKQASAAVGNVGRQAASASDQLGGMWHLALLAGAAVGIHKAEHALIGFNQEVQDAKISLTAMLSGQLGQSWKEAEDNANGLYNEFQRFSTQTPVTTQQILEFGKAISAATFQAGGGVEELKNLTEQGVIAGKVLAGDRGAGYVELEFTEMLSGVINKRMIFARQLLGMGHITEEAFKAMSGKQRIGTLQKILNSDAMNNARDAFGKSFTGVTSTAWDKLQIEIGKTGLPLFQAITERVKQLNEWLEKNKDTVAAFAKTVGEKLVTAFDALLTVLEFVWDHATFFEGVLIAMGAFITAFAAKAVISWAIAFWPITLAIASIATLHSAIKWLFGDADDEATQAAGAMGNYGDAIDQAAGGDFDRVHNSMERVTASTIAGTAALKDFWGATIDPNKVKTGLESISGSSAGLDGIDKVVRAKGARQPGYLARSASWIANLGADDEGESVPTVSRPSLPRGVAAARAAAAAPPPVVNVSVSGNMPEGWIDTKIDSAIQDHHDTTWRNAAAANQADEDGL